MWRKSSYCNGADACVEVAWKRAQSCGHNQNCVEVGTVGDEVLVRDSKNPDGPTLRFTPEEWAAFTAGVRGGEFDIDALASDGAVRA